MTVYIATLGYDEKFIVRFLLRRRVKESDKILLITPKGFREDKKALTAFNNINSLIKSTVNKLDIYEINYANNEAIREIIKLKSFLESYTADTHKIWICLSGGMRVVIIYTLLAVKRLGMDYPKKIWVEIDFENLQGSIGFPLNPFFLPRNNRFISILETLEDRHEKTSLRKISDITGMSLATVHRITKEMKYIGLIDDRMRLTSLGKAYLELYKL